ncbi:unnamed protein product [Oikopleura dioica]|uniref:RRM domain-containing protein n=1 Tax=Oikopleura dioica TaxID=34765 RepID=E4XTW0_OIKDI|nr:unnamed protein product [Oikopleura dioica]
MFDGTPCHTLYVKNLNDKIKKIELTRQLYAMFSTYGMVLDIMVSKAPKLRGQAFITYKDISDAANALKRMQGFPFYEKAMMISFAKRESHVITQAKKYVPPKDERTLAKETNAKLAAKKKPAGDEEEPAATIYVENLPDEANESMLNLLFSQFPGFKKSRPIPAGGKAFVEFADPGAATSAKDALQGFKVTPDRPIKLTYAKN